MIEHYRYTIIMYPLYNLYKMQQKNRASYLFYYGGGNYG